MILTVYRVRKQFWDLYFLHSECTGNGPVHQGLLSTFLSVMSPSVSLSPLLRTHVLKLTWYWLPERLWPHRTQLTSNPWRFHLSRVQGLHKIIPLSFIPLFIACTNLFSFTFSGWNVPLLNLYIFYLLWWQNLKRKVWVCAPFPSCWS